MHFSDFRLEYPIRLMELISIYANEMQAVSMYQVTLAIGYRSLFDYNEISVR